MWRKENEFLFSWLEFGKTWTLSRGRDFLTLRGMTQSADLHRGGQSTQQQPDSLPAKPRLLSLHPSSWMGHRKRKPYLTGSNGGEIR